MASIGPISRRDLVRHLRQLGFQGPISAAQHQFMRKGRLKVFVPNPHQGDIGPRLLSQILRQAGISRDEWEAL